MHDIVTMDTNYMMEMAEGELGKMLKWLGKAINQKSPGFTLIEIAIVVTIIAVLAGVMLPRAIDLKSTAEKNAAAVNTRNLQTAVDLYYTEKDKWPTSGGSAGVIVAEELVPKYINKMPNKADGTNWEVDANGIVK